MDIEKEREEFEKEAFKQFGGWATFHKAYGDVYENNQLNFAWKVWLAAKQQATPEGFVLVHKELPEEIAEAMAKERVPEPREENDPVWLEIAKDAYKSQIMSKKWELWRDYKAMIEAQEQSHD